jgi:acetyl-CoA carboxylase carboxyl transferase subunit alpha
LGGAHRDVEAVATTLKSRLIAALNQLCAKPVETLVEQRHARLMQYGVLEET